MWATPRRTRSEASEDAEIVVNVGGTRHVMCASMLERYPTTRLAHLADRAAESSCDLSRFCDDYDAATREFFFDRDPDAFRCIAEVYQYGEVHMARGTCPVRFSKEMEFWGVDMDLLDECCKSNLKEAEDELSEIAEKVRAILDDMEGSPSNGKCRTFLWRLMEKPESSWAARTIALLSFLFVLLSSVVMCVGTVPELHEQDDDGNRIENPSLEAIETACIIWFTVEYVLRLAAAPSKLHFAISFMNVVDFLAIAPFYLLLVLSYLGTAVLQLATVQQAVQALRVMRVARVLKLARHSSGLQTLTYALRSSCKELGLLLMYMGIGIFLFSALGYTVEQSHPETMFTSIPQSFWWAIITMTTVGYGDIYPKTTLGRCNAAVSFLCGVIAIALPIHPIINNFVVFYSKQRVLETAAKHEIELMALRSKEGEPVDATCLEFNRSSQLMGDRVTWDCASPNLTSQSDGRNLLLVDAGQNTPCQKCKNRDG